MTLDPAAPPDPPFDAGWLYRCGFAASGDGWYLELVAGTELRLGRSGSVALWSVGVEVPLPPAHTRADVAGLCRALGRPIEERRPAPRRGFVCPVCQSPTALRATRSPSAGLIVRYRKCVACGHRLITEERLAPARMSVAEKRRARAG